MLKNLAFIAISSLLLASCQSKTKTDDNALQQNNFKVEDQIVDEGIYQTIDSEKQAEQLNEAAAAEAAAETVEVQDRVFFGYDSSKIDEASAKILDVQIDWLKNNPKIQVTIEGHCDERGTREYNIALGEKRAIAVKNYLQSKGVEPSRINTISYGKERPAYFGTSQDVQAKNRRAVVVVN